MSDNRATVGAIYGAFGKGDVAAILGHMADDVQWEYAWSDTPIPWLVPGHGPEHVRGFFRVLLDRLQFNSFAVNHVLGGEGIVVALVSLDATVRATGKHIVETDEPHVWYFDESGRVSRFRHAADTYQQFQALQPARSRPAGAMQAATA